MIEITKLVMNLTLKVVIFDLDMAVDEYSRVGC